MPGIITGHGLESETKLPCRYKNFYDCPGFGDTRGPVQEILNIFKVISDYFGYNNFSVIKKFIELNERKLIVNNDLTSYKTFDELELQMSLASLRLIDKEMEKQVQKLYETNEYIYNSTKKKEKKIFDKKQDVYIFPLICWN